MTLITPSELAALQDVVTSGFKTTVRIYNATVSQTDDGQASSYPATPNSTVLGWLYEMTPNSATLSVIDAGSTLSEIFRLLLPIGTVVNPGDKVVIGTTSYYVQHTNADNTYQTGLELALRALV